MQIPKWCFYLKPINVASTFFTAFFLIVGLWTEAIDEQIIMKVLITYAIFLTASFIVYKIYVPSEKHLDFYDKDSAE